MTVADPRAVINQVPRVAISARKIVLFKISPRNSICMVNKAGYERKSAYLKKRIDKMKKMVYNK